MARLPAPARGTTKEGGEVVELRKESESWRADSNRGPADYESAALPTELRQHILQIRMVMITARAEDGHLGHFW